MSHQLALIFVACFAPSLAWLGYFYLKDEYEREPLHHLLLVFGAGLLGGPIALVLFEGIESFPFYGDLSRIDVVSDLYKLVYSVFAIGVVEELSKFVIFWFFITYNHIDFDEPLDGVVYAAAAALGFATIENWYFMIAVETPIWSRAVTLPFNHALFASFWGAAMGVARCEGRSSMLIVKGLLLAIVFHGLYDYILFTDSVPNYYVAPLILVLWIWVSVTIRHLLNRSPHKKESDEEV